MNNIIIQLLLQGLINILQGAPESQALLLDLDVELVPSHPVNVLDPVLRGHRDLVPIGLQQLHAGLSVLLHVDGEVEAQVGHVSLVRLKCLEVPFKDQL